MQLLMHKIQSIFIIFNTAMSFGVDLRRKKCHWYKRRSFHVEV